jgi:hypothetical protein
MIFKTLHRKLKVSTIQLRAWWSTAKSSASSSKKAFSGHNTAKEQLLI